ncbi:MAG: hypothetical protein PHO85_03250 [Candidatus Cloacimonetes bacterium]|jgi:hypothetical protein|nr:hypothetical protein [Candidatus Cloacimonadota bacterium]MDD2506320.1 hypothetical protein [Candidatus Cloacimonadota bacterium]MDD4147518.1 hypothetical protein [Candidatus Cloacimonadota bacterium]MDD4560112.1 hypothetical protein [Candidatus Cloacimonadota bacterium]
MGVLLDVLGSVIIGATLLLMIMTFQLQLQETAGRIYYTSSMIDHMDAAARNVNHIFAMAGVGIPADSICVSANSSSIKFRTYWDCDGDSLSDDRHLIEMKVVDYGYESGKVLEIRQDGSVIMPLGHILFIENMTLNYYNINGVATTTLRDIMSAEILLTFRRDSPWRPAQPLRSNLQLKCFFMNAYLQEGGW